MPRSYSALYAPTDSLPAIIVRLGGTDYRFSPRTRLPLTIALAMQASLPNPPGLIIAHALSRLAARAGRLHCRDDAQTATARG